MIDVKEKLRRVELVPYDKNWPSLFAQACYDIAHVLQENCIEIHHIGSTAIPDIYAKPIIDMLPIVKDINTIDSLNTKFEKLGFICMGEYGIKGRRFYWKSEKTRTHHIHLFQKDSPEIARHIAFKNFLISHSHFAQAYSVIKRCLAEVFSEDIENYVKAKSSFVQLIEYKANVATQKQLNASDNICIEPYNPAWPKLAEAEMNAIKRIFSSASNLSKLSYNSIDHIGSTAVPDLASKPIIDILITVENIHTAAHLIQPLESLGYIFWKENPEQDHLRFFKGMPPFGQTRTHHVHIIDAQNPRIEHSILFRNILKNNLQARSDYEQLKLTLSRTHSHDREAYTHQKTNFIQNLLRAHGYLKSILR